MFVTETEIALWFMKRAIGFPKVEIVEPRQTKLAAGEIIY
jgi:hypothetical protein